MRRERKEKNTFSQMISLVKVVVISAAVIFVVGKVETMFEDEPEITNSFISEKLEAASELTTAELTYNGLIKYEDGEVPLLTKKGFSMIYRAEVDAVIDLSKVESSVTDKRVTVTLPSGIQTEVVILTDSIQFYDERAALFNWTEKEDVLNAQKRAEQDVLDKANIEELEEKAKEQAEAVIKGLLEEAAGEREIIIEWV